MNPKNIPTILVIFGVTGDLMAKKIGPALFHLFKKKKLPKMFHIIGVSRRNLDNAAFHKMIVDNLKKHRDIDFSEEEKKEFLRLFSYRKGDFTNKDEYEDLAKVLGRIDNEWKVCSNKLFYLAVPPQYYETIFINLSKSGLTLPCSPEEGWTRVLVEKPFGKDLKTAEDLDMLLGKLFKEEQIYRIDHYLAKEMLQNILTFRFANNLLESSWNNQYIEKIEIRVDEQLGVEGRGAFYDGIGALRDVGQNHLMMMLSLVMMDKPASFDSESVRKMRAEILKTLKKPTKEQIKQATFRGQYIGYQNTEGVNKNSQTETYFKVKTFLDSARWQGVPITLESGKRIRSRCKEIVVTFKPSIMHKVTTEISHMHRNTVTFSLEPKESITITFASKVPGLLADLEERTFLFNFRTRRRKTQFVEEYEKLLLDCIEGNQLLFLSTDEVTATWKYIDPIIAAWQKNEVPLVEYKPDSNQILKTAMLADYHSGLHTTKKEIGIIGLGKMGGNVARNLIEKRWSVVGFNRTAADTELLAKEGVVGSFSVKELVAQLKAPRIIWLMLPAGKPVDEMLFAAETGLSAQLQEGDIIIDAGNSLYKDTILRAEKLQKIGIKFMDVGFSGGPSGARYGGSLMVGGDRQLYDYLQPLFIDLAVAQGVAFFEGNGAGHFVKMIHNGIEYGMMQAIAEGFSILKKAEYNLNLEEITSVYNHGSVIESKLIGWLENAFKMYGQNLKGISGTVAHTGEGAWTIKAAEELSLKAKVIEDALKFRVESEKNPSYAGQILSALRNQFGGHSAK